MAGSLDVCAECGPGRCDGTTQSCTLESYYANPANGPRPAATAQNPAKQAAGTPQNPFWYTYRYGDDAPPTERAPAPAPLRCECGTGVHERSGCHSHWCPCWVAP